MLNIERPDDPRCLIAHEQIAARVSELARDIEDAYLDVEGGLVAVCILKGSFVFFSDLIREINLPLSCEFLGVSSYGDQMKSSGEVKITLDLTSPVKDKHLLIVEDIVDSGTTLNYLIQSLMARSPASIRVCSLLAKPQKHVHPVEIDFLGFNVGDEFVVGYGIDHAERYRGLSYIGAADKKI